MKHLLIANRGEIAVRIARAAASLGIRTTAVAAADDRIAAHGRAAGVVSLLPGNGARAFLDRDALVAAALASACDAVHPGYGFLSEDAEFARRVGRAGLTFVGPSPETLELFGDKVRARAFASSCGVPVVPGTESADATLDDVRAFLEVRNGPIVIKARSGGGGRGMRVVREAHALEEAYARCRSEALAAFGDAAVYAEALLEHVRHVEVQTAGDGKTVAVLGDRDCSLQRRFQKMLEIAPAPALECRGELAAAAFLLASSAHLEGLATIEFLVTRDPEFPFAFIETNARVQVEHTITEELTGLDLVALQLRIASGATLKEAGVSGDHIGATGSAMQARINAERLDARGEVRPATGTLAHFSLAGGPGVRVDTHLRAGDAVDASYDSLLAKVIVVSRPGDAADALSKLARALDECEIEGIATNLDVLRELARRPELADGTLTTSFFDERVEEFARAGRGDDANVSVGPRGDDDPHAHAIAAPLSGRVVSIDIEPGAIVRPGDQVAVLESMKMEHVVTSDAGGTVARICYAPGDVVSEGEALVRVSIGEVEAREDEAADLIDPGHVRPDLAKALARRDATLDAARPQAIGKRHAAHGRSARENIEDLCDDGTFVEYGGLALAAQRRRRPIEELIAKYPADGIVAGVGDVNGSHFSPERARCAVLAYDYTVFAGTQGAMNHKKTDRLLDLAERHAWPIVLYAEGGGGRPGDTDALGVAGLDVTTFARYASLAGRVPRVGIAAGRCFAGNAALFGCSDVTIATANASIGMGGPAMIEGGGLGVFAPEAVGPLSMQVPNGVVDVAVADEAEATAVAKKYLSYFQGTLSAHSHADQRELRSVVPENRLRAYDIRRAIALLADDDSVLELRSGYAAGMVTALARVEGAPLGIVANNPKHLAGAIDSEGADKASRFMQLCDAFGLPILFLCDCPGFMVGPGAEATGLVRHASRMFLTGARLRVPFFTIVVRKGYGLGAMATAGGGFHSGVFTISWPTGEFGAMGLEGAVRLGFRAELEAIADPAARQVRFDAMVAQSYAHGEALNMASFLEIDDVIDPADSRRWIVHGMRSARDTTSRDRFVDAW